jgi:hypothetical protein
MLSRKLEMMHAICTDAGVQFESLAADAIPAVPPSLIVASHSPRPGGEPVLLRSRTGNEVIAVVNGEGDPALWWACLQPGRR